MQWLVLNFIQEISTSSSSSFIWFVKTWSTQSNPSYSKFCIVCAHQEPPVFVDLETNEKKQLPEPEIDEEVLGKETKVLMIKCVKIERNFEQKASKQANDSIAVFNKTGSRIFTGNFRGVVAVIETDTLKILYFFRVPGCAPIKQIAFSRAGKQFLVNSTDRIIRLYEVTSNQPINIQHINFIIVNIHFIHFGECFFFCNWIWKFPWKHW